MSAPSRVKNQAESIGAGEEKVEAQQPGNGGENAVPAGFGRKGQKEGDEKSEKNMKNAEGAAEDHPRFVGVCHGPANKVRVGLISEGVGDDANGDGESGRMSGMLEGVQLEVVSFSFPVTKTSREEFTQAVRSF